MRARGVNADNATYSVKREILPTDLGVFYDRAIEAGRDALAAEIGKLAKENKLLQ
jgi:hypothetical protein